jgi:integrase
MLGKITKRSVEALQPNSLLWDTALNGFGARRQRGPGVYYVLRYRWAGTQRIDSIGRHGSPWTPDTARNEATRKLGLVATSVDPRRPKGDTFADLAERYLTHCAGSLRPKSLVQITRHLRHDAASLHDRGLAEIDRRTVAALLGEIEKRSSGVTRNRVRSDLSALWSWAIREDLAEINPVTGTGKAIEVGRDRVLSTAELAQLWRNLGAGTYTDVVRLLILTGQRRQEIGRLRWSEITGATIMLSADRTKNHRAHTVPLAPQALAIINRQPRQGEFIFGKAGFSGWSDAKAALDARLRLPGWHLHDLRRSAATGMAELGVLPHIIEAILNHVSGHRAGVAGIYNRARYEGEMRDALAKWARHVESLDVPRHRP